MLPPYVWSKSYYDRKMGQEKDLDLPLTSKTVKQKVIIFLGVLFMAFLQVRL